VSQPDPPDGGGLAQTRQAHWQCVGVVVRVVTGMMHVRDSGRYPIALVAMPIFMLMTMRMGVVMVNRRHRRDPVRLGQPPWRDQRGQQQHQRNAQDEPASG